MNKNPGGVLTTDKCENLEALFAQHGVDDHRWIDPKDIVVAQWVRMKCMYGCDDYGRRAACPPNVPPVAECRQFFDEYRTAAMVHVVKTAPDSKERQAWSGEVNKQMLALERDVFLAGYRKAFLLFMASCRACSDCESARQECKQPKLARPTVEAMAVDVFATAHGVGYPIDVLTDPGQAMNRYALLLIE